LISTTFFSDKARVNIAILITEEISEEIDTKNCWKKTLGRIEQGSLIECIFNLSIFSLGVGLLALPQKVGYMSLFMTPMIIISGAVINYWTLIVLSDASRKFKLTKYDSNMEITEQILEEYKKTNFFINEFIFIKGLRLKGFEGSKDDDRDVIYFRENENCKNDALPVVCVSYNIEEYQYEEVVKKENENLEESEDDDDEEEEEINEEQNNNNNVVEEKKEEEKKEEEKKEEEKKEEDKKEEEKKK